MDKVELRNFEYALEKKYDIELRLALSTDNYEKQFILLCNILIYRKTERHKGIGTATMKEIIEYANQNKIPIALNPSDIYGSDLKKLIRFYRKFNFKQNRTKRRFTEDMVYYPKINLFI